MPEEVAGRTHGGSSRARAGVVTCVCAVVAGGIACGPAGGGNGAVSTAGTGAGEVSPVATDPTWEPVEEEVSFEAAGLTVRGTISRPDAEGRHPALLLIAGSGPTDRNWNSPMIPGTNGSGRLLAHALSRRGVVVLRYDKRGTGATGGTAADLTWDGYLAEQLAALDLLLAHPSVDPAMLFVAGHSEGGVHALRLLASTEIPIAGLLLLAAPGHSMKDTMVRQVEAQFHVAVQAGEMDGATAEEEVRRFDGALSDIVAGGPVAPEHVSSIPEMQAMVGSLANPEILATAGPLLAFDPVPALTALHLPVLVLNGENDAQVDPEIDARTLAGAATAAGLPNIRLAVIPDANHVLKHEEAAPETLDPAAAIVSYGAADRDLEPAVVATIAQWLQTVIAASAPR